MAGALNLPDWSLRFVACVLFLGFPLAVIFSWVFELTPEEVRREAEILRNDHATGGTGK